MDLLRVMGYEMKAISFFILLVHKAAIKKVNSLEPDEFLTKKKDEVDL